jgi:hypothetical protein
VSSPLPMSLAAPATDVPENPVRSDRSPRRSSSTRCSR